MCIYINNIANQRLSEVGEWMLLIDLMKEASSTKQKSIQYDDYDGSCFSLVSVLSLALVESDPFPSHSTSVALV